MLPRRFALIRHIDYTGVSGIGVVAYGVTFADGQVVLRWCSTYPATSMWNSMEDMLAVHGHGEGTSVEWIDAPYGDLEEFPPQSTRQRGRRRADRAAARGAASEDDTDGTTPVEQAARPAAHESPAPASARDDAASGAVPGESPETTSEPLPRRRPAGPDLATGPADPRAPGDYTGSRVTVEEGERASAEQAARSAEADDATSSRRERPALRSVRRGREAPGSSLLASSESDERNGHLYIDTAPLLLTFRDRQDEPVGKRPQRRGGRHRRIDPDAAG